MAIQGVPHRRGYLLYGAPGSGKTSLIHGLAGELGLDIYILSLTNQNMDDATLKSAVIALPFECIVLIEDIDVAFRHGVQRRFQVFLQFFKSFRVGVDSSETPVMLLL